MSYVDDLVSQISDKLSSIESMIADMATDIILTRKAVSGGALAHIPGGTLVADTVVLPCLDLADNCNTALYSLVANCRLQVAFAGSPDNLRATADTIDDKLVGVAKSLSPTLVLGKIPSALDSNYSDGEASERYEHAIDGRDAAVVGVADYSSPVASALRDLADAIENFYQALLGLVLGAILTVVGLVALVGAIRDIAAGAVGTGLTAGAASALLVAGIIEAAAALAAAALGTLTLINSYNSLLTTTRQVNEGVVRNLGETVPHWPAVIKA